MEGEQRVRVTYQDQFGDEFQLHALAVCIRVRNVYKRFESALDPLFWNSEAHRVIAKTAFEILDEHDATPSKAALLAALSDQLPEDKFSRVKTQVSKLYKEDVSDSEHVTSLLRKFGRHQAMCNAVIQAAEKIDAGKDDEVEQLIDEANKVGSDLSDKGLVYHTSAIDYIEQRYATVHDTTNRVPTGLEHLDYAMSGGLNRGELGVILGPPKRGKSVTLANIAFGGIRRPHDFTVAYVSCEMKQEMVGIRIDKRLMGDDNHLYATEQKRYYETLSKRIRKYVGGNLFLKGFPTRTASSRTIRSFLSILEGEGEHVDCLIVDYADIMRPIRRKGEMRHEQAGVYEDLRQLAGEYDMAVWTASQGNSSSSEATSLTMRHFAEAFEKSAIMDIGIGVCQTLEEKSMGLVRLSIIGAREVADGAVVLCVDDRDKYRLRSVALLDSELSVVVGSLSAGESGPFHTDAAVNQMKSAIDNSAKRDQYREGKKEGYAQKYVPEKNAKAASKRVLKKKQRSEG